MLRQEASRVPCHMECVPLRTLVDHGMDKQKGLGAWQGKPRSSPAVVSNICRAGALDSEHHQRLSTLGGEQGSVR